MDLTETIDFDHQPKSVCSCAAPQNHGDDPTRAASDFANGAEDWCSACNCPIQNMSDSIDNLAGLLEDDVFESARTYVPDALIGKQLSEFRIQERIGSGGMARVYLAFDTILQRHVALKVIQNRKYVSTQSQAAVLQSEAISQAQLHHQNVVSIFHVGSHDGLPFLAMEYVDGCSLADCLKQVDSIPFKETLDYAQQILAGLSEAYEHGLIHGDIKPANLLVADEGTLKLSDFGLARRAEEKSEISKKLIGTPSFMAPELFANHPIDEQTDLFSLGVTLFQLTFGRAPYLLMGETAEEVKHEIEISEIDFPEQWPAGVPLKWKSLLEKLLAKDRSQRYQSIEQVKADIDDLSRPVIAAKPITKIAALMSENLLFFFLAIPFLNAMAQLDSSEDLISEFSGYLWCLGPFSMFAISVMLLKSLSLAIFQLKVSIDSKQPKSHVDFALIYALQLAPVLICLFGLALVPFLGSLAIIWAMWMAVGIGGLQILDIAIGKHHASLQERWGRYRLVVDQSTNV